jgi:protease-4
MLGAPIRLVLNLLTVARWLLEWLLLWPIVLVRRRSRRFVRLRLRGPYRLSEPRALLSFRKQDTTYESLDAVLRLIEQTPSVEGVLLRLESPQIALTDAVHLRNRLARFRLSGKRVVVHFDSAGPIEMALSSAADTIFMAPAGRIMLLGLKLELTFVRELLARLGLRAQFIHIGRFKTAAHMFTRGGPTESQRWMMERLLDDLSDEAASLVIRPGSPAADAPIYDVSKARRAGLIDHQAFADQIDTRLRAEGGTEDFDPYGTYGSDEIASANQQQLAKLRAVQVVEGDDFAGIRPRPLRLRPLLGRIPEIAVVEMSGLIVSDPPPSGPMRSRPSISPDSVRKLFRKLRSRRSVRSVVLVIDSRGGSALASDLIWREVRRLRHEKPVVACLRSVAASGGYYIAVGAHEIVAEATTITGSIGIIAGKISAEELLDRAGMSSETLVSSTFATMLGPRHPFTQEQIEALRADIRQSYRRFVNRVATGRGMPSERVHRLARGRVYAGREAAAVGLVDHVGCLEDAIDRACSLAEIERKATRTRFHNLRKAGLRTLLTGSISESTGWLGVADSAVHEALDLVMLLRRDPVVAYWEGMIRL